MVEMDQNGRLKKHWESKNNHADSYAESVNDHDANDAIVCDDDHNAGNPKPFSNVGNPQRSHK